MVSKRFYTVLIYWNITSFSKLISYYTNTSCDCCYIRQLFVLHPIWAKFFYQLFKFGHCYHLY